MLCLSAKQGTCPSAGPFAWGKGSCLELVFARDAWRDAWLRAEDQDGQEQLADILDRPNAWDPSPSVAENMPYQQTLQKGNSRWGFANYPHCRADGADVCACVVVQSIRDPSGQDVLLQDQTQISAETRLPSSRVFVSPTS